MTETVIIVIKVNSRKLSEAISLLALVKELKTITLKKKKNIEVAAMHVFPGMLH